MFEIPIFDSLVHPTLDQGWFGKPGVNKSIPDLLRDMDAANIVSAIAVGLEQPGSGFQLAAYAHWIRSQSKRLYPVATVSTKDLGSYGSVEKYLDAVVENGYIGVKIHPRLSGVSIGSPVAAQLARGAASRHFPLFLCTYNYKAGAFVETSELLRFIESAQETSLVLLHGGVTRLLEVLEVARMSPNVLVDLSFTMCKYEGSSLDLDLTFAFRTFDQRICVGSDGPEFSPAQLRARFEQLSQGLPKNKRRNIACENLQRVIGVENGCEAA
jgi:predicted TIM-barrel fold metal-dependent hydrolase